MGAGMRLRIGVAGAALLLAAACGGSGGGDGASGGTGAATGSGATGPRPESTAELRIVSPDNGSVVRGTSVRVAVELENARIVPQTTKEITPDTGHLHVFVDDTLVSMTEGTEQDVGNLTPGVHRLQVEFVAADHAPFDPRVIAVATFDVRP